MEKLLDLLNEYSKKKHNLAMRELNGEYGQGFHYLNYGSSYSELLMVSKKYGFIKWLVENDKIEKGKIDTRLVKSVESHYDVDGWWVENSYEDYSDTDTLLMLLSISNSPIEDLISYLK